MKIKSQGVIREADPRLCPDLESPEAAPAPIELRSLRVSQQYFSEEIAAKLSIGAGLGSGSASATEKAYAMRYEALLESDGEFQPVGDIGFEKVDAVGVVLDLSVVQSNLNIRFDIFSVAAAVQLGFAKAQYSTKVFPSDNMALRKLVPEGGTFDIGNYEKIIAGITAVKDELASHAKELTPQTFFRPSKIFPSLDSELVLSQTVAFAIRCLAKSKSARIANEDAVEKNLDVTVVRLVYESFWPDMKEDETPPRDVNDAAKTWLADNFNE